MNIKKRGVYSGQLDDESACVILDQFFATGGLGGSAERVLPKAGLVAAAEAALARDAAVVAMQEEHEEAKREAAERGDPAARAPEDAYDMMGERWVPKHFDFDALDLEGEIAKRAAALDAPTNAISESTESAA